MVDRRQVACRLPMASQWAASDRETECLADLYSESESLLERSLLPLLACRAGLSLTAPDIVFGVGIFLIGEVILSRILYRAHLRDEPY
jgi:hypothetical protein